MHVVHEHEKPKSLHEKEKKEPLKCMLYEREKKKGRENRKKKQRETPVIAVHLLGFQKAILSFRLAILSQS